MRRSIHRKYVPRNNIEQAFSPRSSTSFTVADVTRRFHGQGRKEEEEGEVGDFVYNNLGITSVVNRFVVNVALGYIDVNASAGLKNVFKVLCSELSCNATGVYLSLLDAIILLRA